MTAQIKAPDLRVSQWLNASAPITLESLRGRVVALVAFQMLCPGCVSHGLPQAKRIADTFSPDQVAVIGLHTVFEHHAANSPATLEAFLHENAIGFPVGIDAPAAAPADPIPRTMRAYAMQGTPTLILIDATGRIRRRSFGHVPDLVLGAEIAQLVGEAAKITAEDPAATPRAACADGACAVAV
ncbi:MAG: redoxin domain-containing protein [Pseudomonadota bacterium]